MKEACEGAYREREHGSVRWKCLFTCKLAPACATVHSAITYMILINLLSFTVLYSPPCSLSLCLPLTLSLSFCHNSKYPVGPGCRLLVLVYLALGSIRLQAEASHSSQSHKMWLVLTTALQGDGLIGLIASDRLGWTLHRKTAATACCGFILAFFLFLFSLLLSICFFFALIFVNHLYPPSFYLTPFVFIFSCLFTKLYLFLCLLHVCAQITQQQSNLNANIVGFTVFLSCKVTFKDQPSIPLKPHSLYPHTVYLCGMWPPPSANHRAQSLLVAESSSKPVTQSEVGK